MQASLVVKDDEAQGDNEEFRAAERESIKQNGWNVAQYLGMVQQMPTHQKLLDDSIARAEDVRADPACGAASWRTRCERMPNSNGSCGQDDF